MAMCDLGHARSRTRGKHSADVTLPLRSSLKLHRADDKKICPTRRRDEEGRLVLLS